MDEKKTKVAKKIEDTMACSAFAEAGEPCPIDSDNKTDSHSATPRSTEGQKKSTSQSVQDTMACTAFAEAGEPCPIGSDEETDEQNTPK